MPHVRRPRSLPETAPLKGLWLAVLVGCRASSDIDDTDTTVDTDDGAQTGSDDTDAPADTDNSEPCAVEGVICRLAGTVGLDPVSGEVVGEAALGADGLRADASSLYMPASARVGPDGLVYIADFNNHRIRRIDADGLVQTVAGSGVLGDTVEGPAVDSSFNHPTDVAWGPGDSDTMWIASWHNSRIDSVDMTTGMMTHVAGAGSPSYAADGTLAASAGLGLVSTLNFRDDGTLYFVDQFAPGVRAIKPDGTLSTLAGRAPVWSDVPQEPQCPEAPCLVPQDGWSGDDGQATDAAFRMLARERPTPGAWLDRLGDVVYVADTFNHVVRSIHLQTGVITHVAGTGEVAGHAGDGGPAVSASLDGPTGIAVDDDGTLYVADTGNHCVRRIAPDGTIATFAGVCGERGFDGDGGPALGAHLAGPLGVTVDRVRRRLLIADQYNNLIRTIAL